MTNLSKITLLVGIVLFSMQSNVEAQTAPFAPYSQNFEGLDASDTSPNVLGENEGWWVGANVFDPGGNFLYNYFSFPAPNDGFAFSQIATDLGGPAQGVQHLNIFSDYNNGDHGNGFTIDASVFQEFMFAAADVGTEVSFQFDFRAAEDPFGPSGSFTTNAFVRVLDQNNSFVTVFEDIFDTTNATLDWSENNIISFDVDPSFEGLLVQFGFNSAGTNFDPSGIIYDNISIGDAPDCVVGDLNGDGAVTLLDVGPFVTAITDGMFLCTGDVNEDGIVDLLDVQPFVSLLTGG